MQVYYIYKITCLINQKAYIGFSSNPKGRWSEHKYAAKTGTKNIRQALYASIRKYGTENFSFEILCCCKDQQYTLKILEPQFIKEHKTHSKKGWGYNLTDGGEGNVGYVASEETRNKLKNHVPWNKGKKGCQEAWNKGKKLPSLSEEQKQKLSEATIKARQNKFWSSGRKKKTDGLLHRSLESYLTKFFDFVEHSLRCGCHYQGVFRGV